MLDRRDAEDERQRGGGGDDADGSAGDRQHEALGQQLVTSCRGDAPMATRTAISRSRDSARVSSSDATFRQPITSSRPTAPNSTMSAGR